MQTINLKLPDGSTHALNFPDEMSDEQIQSAIHKEYGAPKMDTSSLLPENCPFQTYHRRAQIMPKRGEELNKHTKVLHQEKDVEAWNQ